MKILVTGSAGQLGVAICRTFASDCAVKSKTRDELDLTERESVKAVVRDERPDVILNCAAYNAVDTAEDQVERALAVNAFGVLSLAEEAASIGATLVHYSSDFVFDGTVIRPYFEVDEPNPTGVYAISKLLGEWFSREASHYTLRVESLFGGGAESPKLASSLGGSLDRMADQMLSGVTVSAFVDRTVSLSYVEDVAWATRELLRISPLNGLYHCVGTGSATWFEVANELAQCLDVRTEIKPITLTERALRVSRPQYCSLSNEKLASVGVSMPRWQDALARYASRRLGLDSE